MPVRELVLPVLIGPRIAPAQHILHLVVGPRVQVDALDARDVGAHAAVDARAADAEEDADGPGRPAGVLVAFAVGTAFVRVELDELFERGPVLLRSVGCCGWSARHAGRK